MTWVALTAWTLWWFILGWFIGHVIERRRFDRLLDTARQIRRALNHERGNT